MRPVLVLLLFALSLSSHAADVSVRFFPRDGAVARPRDSADVLAIVASDSTDSRGIRVRITFDPAIVVESVTHWPFLWECSSGPGEVNCTNPRFSSGSDGQIRLRVHMPPDPAGGDVTFRAEVTSEAADANPANNTATKTWYLAPQLIVTNTADAGEGSLRAAIAEANAVCAPLKPCDIRFSFPAGSIPVIEPLTPLPAVTACGVTIGNPPPAFGIAPIEVELSGTRIADRRFGEGLELKSACLSNVRVFGVAINGFPANGIAITARSSYVINGCFIGSDATGTRAMPNGLRGIAVTAQDSFTAIHGGQVSGNGRSGIALWEAGLVTVNGVRIGVGSDGSAMPNWASGIFVGTVGRLRIANSVVANHPDFGLALVREQTDLQMSGTTITNNSTLDIDWHLNGPSPNDDLDVIPNTPRITAATYDEPGNVTRFTIAIEGPPVIEGYSLVVSLYASEGTTRFGTAHLEQFLASKAIGNGQPGNATFTIEVPGDLRGKHVSAVNMRWSVQAFLDSPAPEMVRISEVSGAVRVE
jgi:hypothetical protein